MTDKLRAAAQAVVDRWETPLWKDAPATAGYIAALRDALAGQQADHSEQPIDMVGRWYMVDKMGMATLCASKADAGQEAESATLCYPHMGPHRAVRLVEVSDQFADASKTMAAPAEYALAPLAPTDDELAAFAAADEFLLYCSDDEFVQIARAVLAKWAPQPVAASAAEFALQALVAAGHVSQELVDRAMVLPGTPQQAPVTQEGK